MTDENEYAEFCKGALNRYRTMFTFDGMIDRCLRLYGTDAPDVSAERNGTGAETPIGMDIVIAGMMCLQNGTGAETPKQIDEIRNQIPETRKLIPETRNQIDRKTE